MKRKVFDSVATIFINSLSNSKKSRSIDHDESVIYSTPSSSMYNNNAFKYTPNESMDIESQQSQKSYENIEPDQIKVHHHHHLTNTNTNISTSDPPSYHISIKTLTTRSIKMYFEEDEIPIRSVIVYYH